MAVKASGALRPRYHVRSSHRYKKRIIALYLYQF